MFKGGPMGVVRQIVEDGVAGKEPDSTRTLLEFPVSSNPLRRLPLQGRETRLLEIREVF
jgi:hypothetical protein